MTASLAVAAQSDGVAFAGVYAVRRVVTSSTCPHARIGTVLANLYMLSSEPSGIRATVVGSRLFPELRGVVGGSTLTLAGANGEGGSVSVTLTRDRDGSLHGVETATVVHSSGPCTITRTVSAEPLGR